MGKLPGFTFYPGDWMKDPALRRCSQAARGVWMDMLCLMFECEDRGVLASGGRAWTLKEVARTLSGDERANLRLVGELLRNGVAKRRKSGAVFSDRIVRDDQERKQTKIRVAKHRSNAPCNAHVTPPVTPLYEDEDEDVRVTSSPKTLEVAFQVEEFDAEVAFAALCKLHPRPDTGQRAEIAYLDAIEWLVKTRQWGRSDSADYLKRRAQLYRTMTDRWASNQRQMVKGLSNWLRDHTFDEQEEFWDRDSAKPAKGLDLDKLYGGPDA